jgi:hypothetical protein
MEFRGGCTVSARRSSASPIRLPSRVPSCANNPLGTRAKYAEVLNTRLRNAKRWDTARRAIGEATPILEANFSSSLKVLGRTAQEPRPNLSPYRTRLHARIAPFAPSHIRKTCPVQLFL